MLITQEALHDGYDMDHRWGERLAVDFPVRILRGTIAPLEARLRDVSVSGGYVLSAEQLPLLTMVELHVEVAGNIAHLHGCLVRSDELGYGVEWELESRAIDRVLEMVRESEYPNRQETHHGTYSLGTF